MAESFESAIRFARHNFDNLQALTRFGDAKAGALFALLIFFVGTAIVTLKEAINYSSSHALFWIYPVGFWSSWVSFVIISVVSTLRLHKVISPREASHYSSQVDRNVDLMYWEHILLHETNESYFKALQGVDQTVELRNIADQVYELAHIVAAKMSALRIAQDLMKLSLVFWLAGVCWAISIIGM